MARRKVAVLISGRGSNLRALLDAAAAPDFPAEIALVVSNVPGAGGLAHAALAGVPAVTVDHRDFSDRDSFERAMEGPIRDSGADLICLAGFMRLMSAGFVERWWDRILNIHPSLLPSFRGLDTHARALAAGVRFSGCTVHFVRPAMDDGPIIVQAAVPVHADDDAERLAGRGLLAEHRCYPMALRLVASGRVRVVEERVAVDGAAAPEAFLLNPEG